MERVRKQKLRHAFWLAARLVEAARVGRTRAQMSPLEQLLYNQGIEVFAMERKGLLLQLAHQWKLSEKDHLSEFTALEAGRLCYELRKFLLEAGVKLPRAGRHGQQTLGELLAVIFDLAAERGWGEPTLEAFIARQLRGHGTRSIETTEHAQAVLYGLKGVLRHSRGDAEAQSK